MSDMKVSGDQGRQLEATGIVIRACKNCGAPGVYIGDENEPRVAQSWPKCSAILEEKTYNQPVGSVCPNCGEDRPEDEPLRDLRVRRMV